MNDDIDDDVQVLPPKELFTEDLFKPIWSSAWVALIMALFEGVPRAKKIVLFSFIVLVGVVYFTNKRIQES